MRFWMMAAVLAGALCLGSPPASAQPTGAAIGEALLSREAPRIAEAIETVRANPGAYPPLIFPLLAKALADQDEMAEAAQWQLFGEFRISADLIMLASDGSAVRELRPTALALGAYARDRRVTEHIAGLPFSQKEALLQDVVRLNQTAPRYYPHDWARQMRGGDKNPFQDDWATRNAVWPERANAVRTLVGPALRNQFAEEMGLLGAMRR
jgi:hypothetical protein